MAQSITVTRPFTGLFLTLEAPRIVQVDDLVCGPDAFGIARRPGFPDRDFPIAWILYDSPESEKAPGGIVNYYALQSGDEVRRALRDGVEDLHKNPAPFARLQDYLLDVKAAGIETIPVYAPFGTEAAQPGTWRRGLVEDSVARLIGNLEAGRALAAEGLDEWRAGQGRVQIVNIEKLET